MMRAPDGSERTPSLVRTLATKEKIQGQEAAGDSLARSSVLELDELRFPKIVFCHCVGYCSLFNHSDSRQQHAERRMSREGIRQAFSCAPFAFKLLVTGEAARASCLMIKVPNADLGVKPNLVGSC